MDPAITSSIISVVGTLVVAIFGKISFTKIASLKFRSKHNIIDISGNWSCEWFYDDRIETLKDKIEIKKWTKDSRFEGFGHQQRKIDGQERVFDYPVNGEISPSRIVVLTYKADKYPTQGNIGNACLQLDVSGEKMSGYWSGLGSKRLDNGNTVPALNHGKVECTKIR